MPPHRCTVAPGAAAPIDLVSIAATIAVPRFEMFPVFRYVGLPWLDSLFVWFWRRFSSLRPVRWLSSPFVRLVDKLFSYRLLALSFRCVAAGAAAYAAVFVAPVSAGVSFVFPDPLVSWLPVFLLHFLLAAAALHACPLPDFYPRALARSIAPVLLLLAAASLVSLSLLYLLYSFEFFRPDAWRLLADHYLRNRTFPWAFGAIMVLPLVGVAASSILVPVLVPSFCDTANNIVFRPVRLLLRLTPSALLVYFAYQFFELPFDTLVSPLVDTSSGLIAAHTTLSPERVDAAALLVSGALIALAAVLLLGVAARFALVALQSLQARLARYQRSFEREWHDRRAQTALRLSYVAAIPKDTLHAAWGAFDDSSSQDSEPTAPSPSPSEAPAPEAPASPPDGPLPDGSGPASVSDEPPPSPDEPALSGDLSVDSIRSELALDPEAERAELERRIAQREQEGLAAKVAAEEKAWSREAPPLDIDPNESLVSLGDGADDGFHAVDEEEDEMEGEADALRNFLLQPGDSPDTADPSASSETDSSSPAFADPDARSKLDSVLPPDSVDDDSDAGASPPDPLAQALDAFASTESASPEPSSSSVALPEPFALRSIENTLARFLDLVDDPMLLYETYEAVVGDMQPYLCNGDFTAWSERIVSDPGEYPAWCRFVDHVGFELLVTLAGLASEELQHALCPPTIDPSEIRSAPVSDAVDAELSGGDPD